MKGEYKMNFIIKIFLGLLIGGFFYLIVCRLQKKGYSQTSNIMYGVVIFAIFIASATTNYLNSSSDTSLLTFMLKTLIDVIIFIIILILVLYIGKKKK